MPASSPRFNGAFSFAELQQTETLHTLDQRFLETLQQRDPGLRDKLLAYRAGEIEKASELLLACAPILEEFIADLFDIQKEVEAAQAEVLRHAPVFLFKKQMVLRRARRFRMPAEGIEGFAELTAWLEPQIGADSKISEPQINADDTDDADFNQRNLVNQCNLRFRQENQRHVRSELAVALLAQTWLANPEKHAAQLDKLTRWCVQAMKTPEGRQAVRGWVSFRLPELTDHGKLVPVRVVPNDDLKRLECPPEDLRLREGFKLTDPRMNLREVLGEVDYCIYCHDHQGDFCSRGFPEKKGEPELGLKKDPLGVTLTGCPLDEKISEMNNLKRSGFSIAPLAVVMADNPMCPVTGHRICNDCMKACVYQKQTPVNIPEIETRVLTDVLSLPWGVEIYDLLTRWNPLRVRQYLPRPYNGLKVLIAGMGPAGFTLAHHLLMEGCAVVGIDGLKIEPLPDKYLREPIRDWAELREELDQRVMAGFGGVAEYGITVRWDKNFLKLIYLSLARRPHFQVYGGVRFGGTITVEDAWALGFHHLAIAVGAGLPQALPIPGSLAPGMRQANDFLMALQLSGAARADSLANLQVRLPAVVIGGGLTGVDTATEIQAYYRVQIEKTLARYEILIQAYGEETVRSRFLPHDLAILDEFLSHARQQRAELAEAEAANRPADFITLLRSWGGVTIAYRRAMQESPAYIRNHEELGKALQEGIFYSEGLEPKAVRLDEHRQTLALVCQRREREAERGWSLSPLMETVLPARSIFVATGAKPNIAYEFEHRGHFQRDGFQYQPFHCLGDVFLPLPVAHHCKESDFGPFTSYRFDNLSDRKGAFPELVEGNAAKHVSFIGDTHPVFHGSVVKAVASGMRTYPHITRLFGKNLYYLGDTGEYALFAENLRHLLTACVTRVTRRAPDVVELTVRAPQAARKFQPGQFFRLQNFETHAAYRKNTRLQTESIALLGIPENQQEISLLILENGASSRLCADFQVGQPVSLMGPTGAKAKIFSEGGETLLFIGERLSIAALRAIGPAQRAAGNRLFYTLFLRTAEDLLCQDEIEQIADAILWITESGAPISPRRPQDRAATGDFVEVLARYAAGYPPILFAEITRIHIIGSPRLIKQVKRGVIPLKDNTPVTAAVYGPMQCMMKGVCAQCLQWQIDPATGQRTKAVFACSWQDQPMEIVDWANLDERLGQNRMQENLSRLWGEWLAEDSSATPRAE